MSEEYKRQIRELTNLSSDALNSVVGELFNEKFTQEQRNRILYTAIALQNRSAGGQLLRSSLVVLRGHPEALEMWCNIGKEIGLISINASEEYLRCSPEVLEEIHKEELSTWAALGKRIAERSSSAAVEYFRVSQKMLKTLPLSDLIRWGEEGYKKLQDGKPSSELAAVEYFALETRSSIELSRPRKVALLDEYGRVLKLYAEAIIGRGIEIQSTAWLPATNGKCLYLPISLNAYGNKEENFRLYRALTARLVGRIIYGSFNLDLKKIETKVEEISKIYGTKLGKEDCGTEAFFRLYPNPLLAKDIFDILEDARVERRLRREYKGIGKDLDLFRNALVRGTELENMTRPQAVLQVLLETLIEGAFLNEVPSWIREKVHQCLTIYEAAGDRVEDIALATNQIYGILERLPGLKYELPSPSQERIETPTLGLGKMGQNWWPKSVNWESSGPGSIRGARATPVLRKILTTVTKRGRGVNMLAPKGAKPIESKKSGVTTFRYDEWDYQIGDYRKGWCTVRETTVKAGSARFADKTLASNSALISAVRREFQMFKPERLKVEKKQTDGDEIDLDAIVESYSEIKAGIPMIEGRVYTRRNKIQRDVSTAFLMDLSGSTQGWIIDTEKKALIIMCEALEAIGDRYAIYGFSGASRNDVKFYVVKDFDDEYGDMIKGRIGHMSSLMQNRDGAAIRHATLRLEGLGSKTKLLIVVSDGHPLDEIPRPGEPMYQGEYSIQDTRIALKEARMKGIRPFCVTVDKKATDYIATMYADVNYTIIDNVAKLPERMPAIYRKLST